MVDFEKLKSDVSYALNSANINVNLSKYCTDKEPSESNKECLRIDLHNQSILNECVELLEGLIIDDTEEN